MAEDATAYDAWGRDPAAPLSARLGGMAIAGYLRAVRATSRVMAPQTGFYERPLVAPHTTYIWALWHRHVGLASFCCPDDFPRTCMASRSRDGELLAQVVSRLGTHCARGSSASLDGTDKGGTTAFRQMLRAARGGRHQLVITPDGPKGPPGRVKMGAVSLASAAGLPICPVAFAASRFFTIPTWDGTVIPLPFGRISVFCGEPLAVPRTRDAGLLESMRAEIETRLTRANEEAKRRLAPPQEG